MNINQIIIKNYEKVDGDPKYAVNPNKFNPVQHCFDMDNHHHKAITWNEDVGYVKFFAFTIPKFKRTLLWQLDLPICYAKLCPDNEWIWLVQRNHQNEFSILLYDYQGNFLANKVMADEYGWADFLITQLPEHYAIMLNVANGQDGYCDYQLLFKDNNIHIIKQLEDNLSFLFSFNDNKNAVLLNFYECLIHIVSYPDFKILQSYQFDEEMYYEHLEKITDKFWLFSDGVHWRHYIFNAETLQIEYEIIIEGYEPVLDNDDEMSSNISTIRYHQGKLNFCHYPDDVWMVADFDIQTLEHN